MPRPNRSALALILSGTGLYKFVIAWGAFRVARWAASSQSLSPSSSPLISPMQRPVVSCNGTQNIEELYQSCLVVAGRER